MRHEDKDPGMRAGVFSLFVVCLNSDLLLVRRLSDG